MKANALFAIIGALAMAAPAKAQDDAPLRPLRAWAGGTFIIASPVGEFNDYVGTGWGLSGNFVMRLDQAGLLGLRADAGFVNYGRETKQVCLSTTVGCRIVVDLTTTNDIAYFNIGPQLMLPAGPVRPYANVSLGLSYFATTSSVSGTGNGGDEDFARTTNFDDITFAWQAGTGLRVPIVYGRTPIHLDFGARINTNGRVDYLTEGGIIDNPDGSITLNPIRSDANLVTFSIGASVGVRW